jgi:hypothetical protein
VRRNNLYILRARNANGRLLTKDVLVRTSKVGSKQHVPWLFNTVYNELQSFRVCAGVVHLPRHATA